MRKPRREGAVLCVDANAAFSEQLGQSLKQFGTPVLWAVDGVAALALCRQHPVAVVLLDFAAPIIDHYLLCAQLRSEASQPEVVFLVQSAHDYDSTRARAAGAAGMLDKPLAQHRPSCANSCASEILSTLGSGTRVDIIYSGYAWRAPSPRS
jgi:CheY-like chemotaxis protein